MVDGLYISLLFLHLEKRPLAFMITVEEVASGIYYQRDYDSATSLVIFHDVKCGRKQPLVMNTCGNGL